MGMSSIGNISALLSRYLLNTGGSSAGDLTQLLSGSPNTDSGDTVDFSDASQDALSSFLSSLAGRSSGTDDSSGSSLYDLLISAANTKFVKSHPGLMNMILAVQDAGESGVGSSPTGASDTDFNLISMSASDLLSIIQKYKRLSGATSPTASIHETA